MKTAGLIALGAFSACAAWAGDSAWTGATDQDWNTAGNWSGLSVPGTGDSAFLTNSASAFTVFVSNAPAAAAGSLTISNASANATTLQVSAPFAVQAGVINLGQNGVLDLESGGTMSYWGEAASAPFFNVRNGGEIRINNAGLLLTNLYSATGSANRYFYLGNQSEGRMLIGGGGTFVMSAPSTAASNIVFQLGYSGGGKGLLQMTGNSVFLMPRYYKATSLYVGNGTGASGTVSLAGSAMCLISNLVRVGSSSATGIVTLADNALLRVVGQGGQYGFGMGDSKAYGEVTVKDSAVLDGSGTEDQQLFFGQSGGTAKLNVYGGAVWVQNFFHLGYNSKGYLTLTNGFVYAIGQYERGLSVGMADGTGNVGYGNVSISGGALTVWDQPGSYSIEAQTGLLIGKTQAKSATTTSRSYSQLTMSGGVITNRAYLFVGQGMNATGVVTQTGGTVVQGVGATAERVFIGFGGGSGYYALSNGTFTAVKDVYVGGYPDALWPPTAFGIEATNHWNAYGAFYTNKASCGTLWVGGGTLTASNAEIRVGGQGAGTLVIGPGATCVAKNITLDTNTSSTVRFEFGANGSGTLRATNVLTICKGAKLEVDTRAYQWRAVWTKLIDCASRTGAFSPEDITVTGDGTVRQDRDEDVWLFRPRGTLISVF